VVHWQLNKRQAGTHKAKGRAEDLAHGKKMYKQKGTGGARHGSARVPQFRGGGKAFGPVVRSHAKPAEEGPRARPEACALGQGQGRRIADHHRQGRTRRRQDQGAEGTSKKLGLVNALIIDGAELNDRLRAAARNIPNIDVLPVQGINVYDILRRRSWF
jgi:large subunit ribosomal protein L4